MFDRFGCGPLPKLPRLLSCFETTLCVPSRSFTPCYERLRARLRLPIRGTLKVRIKRPVSRKCTATRREFRKLQDTARSLRSNTRRLSPVQFCFPTYTGKIAGSYTMKQQTRVPLVLTESLKIFRVVSLLNYAVNKIFLLKNIHFFRLISNKL